MVATAVRRSFPGGQLSDGSPAGDQLGYARGAGVKVAVFDTWPLTRNRLFPGSLGAIRAAHARLGPTAGRRIARAATGGIVPADAVFDYVSGSELEEMQCAKRRADGGLAAPYDIRDHGLFIADIIDAIAPNAELSVYRVLNNYGAGDLQTIAAAVQHAIDNRNGRPLLLNLSLAFGPALVVLEEYLKAPERAFEDGARWVKFVSEVLAGRRPTKTKLAALRDHPALQAVSYLFDLSGVGQVLAVAAAGNDSRSGQRAAPRAPACHEGILGVSSAVDSTGKGAAFSNHDDVIEPVDDGVPAFGGDADPASGQTLSGPVGLFTAPYFPDGTGNQTGWARWAGTSFAAPFASGLAACIWSEDPNLAAYNPTGATIAGGAPRDLVRAVTEPAGARRRVIELRRE